ncbi:MAG: hypothetical protein VW171_04190, partial [Alphaproteobacteria bacterium]
MYFDPVLELSTSVLSKVDNWMFSNFEVMISLADNTDRVVVGVLALIVIGILIVLLVSDLSRKNKPQSLDAEEKSKPVLQSSSEHIPSLASANGLSEDTDNEAKDVGKQTEPKADVPKDNIT